MYNLITLVWELTMGCNLRCKHCGSACKDGFKDELSHDDAINVARQIAAVKPVWISLSGGEPLMRSDWPDIVKEIADNDIEVRMVTNGTLLSRTVALKMREVGLAVAAISVDGTESVHDKMRGTGVFKKVIAAFGFLKEAGVSIGVNTTLTKENIGLLDEMYQLFVEYGVSSWQLQPAIPEGRMSEHKAIVLDPCDINHVIDFSLEKNKENKMKLILADSVGYCTKNEVLSRMLAFDSTKPIMFKGCNAGVRSVGILQNGDVVGCTSIRKPEFIVGNLMKRTLKEIWEDPNTFARQRAFRVSDLGPKCQQCKYADLCRGGCANIRLSMGGSMNSDNPLCALYSGTSR